MTEAGWTREKPTKNGWYWWRFDASTSATIVRIMVCGDGSLAEMSNNGHLLLAANFAGEFLGPLSPTDRQQGRVAAFKECEKYARACVHERAVTLDGFTGASAMAGVIRGKQSEAERIAEWCHKLAQQAQKEKGVGE